MHQIKVRIDDLVEKEMSSVTQVKQDDFTATVEQFAIRMNVV